MLCPIHSNHLQTYRLGIVGAIVIILKIWLSSPSKFQCFVFPPFLRHCLFLTIGSETTSPNMVVCISSTTSSAQSQDLRRSSLWGLSLIVQLYITSVYLAMKLLRFSVLAIFLSCCDGDVYLHNPRGTNNRLNERSAQRRNANRLFDSQVSLDQVRKI